MNFEAQKSKGSLITQLQHVVQACTGMPMKNCLIESYSFLTCYLHTKGMTYSIFPSYEFKGGVFLYSYQGPSIKDVRRKSGILDPPPPSVRVKQQNSCENNNRCPVFQDPPPPGKPDVLNGWPLSVLTRVFRFPRCPKSAKYSQCPRQVAYLENCIYSLYQSLGRQKQSKTVICNSLHHYRVIDFGPTQAKSNIIAWSKLNLRSRIIICAAIATKVCRSKPQLVKTKQVKRFWGTGIFRDRKLHMQCLALYQTLPTSDSDFNYWYLRI